MEDSAQEVMQVRPGRMSRSSEWRRVVRNDSVCKGAENPLLAALGHPQPLWAQVLFSPVAAKLAANDALDFFRTWLQIRVLSCLRA